MKRPAFVLCVLLVLFLSLAGRGLYLVLEKDSYAYVSGSSREVVISRLRGEIYDVNGKRLVNRKAEKTIVAVPCDETAEYLENYLTTEQYKELLTFIERGEPYVGACQDAEENFFVKTAEKYNRYTDDGFCCHVVGYINSSENKGVYGIEKSFDNLLKEDEKSLVFRYNTTPDNKLLKGGENAVVYENYNSQKGVRLTIDSEIQRIAENAMHLYGIDKGAVVVLDAKNGEIRAMASTPVFSQNDIASYLSDENSPFLNRAVSAYSVGSVFKLVVATAAIEAGEENFESFCTGSVEIGGTTFSCSSSASHGKMTLSDAFAHSCNTYFIRLALKIGCDRILRTAENLGLGKSFSLADGFYSASGNLPDRDSVKTDGMLANLSFGQGGLLATPLQIASLYSAAVNGGVFIEPKLVVSTVNTDGTENILKEKRYTYRAFSEEEGEKLKKLLMYNFTTGTCVPAKPDNCIAGGKTSTAETGWIDENGKETLHSWFSGFAECGDEVYTITVFKEDGVSGSSDCGPVFREIAQRISQVKYTF